METLFIGKTWIKLNRVDSTNSYAQKLCELETCFEGTIVSATEQFQGKGQREQSWFSQSGANLTCSIILKPHFLSISNQFMLQKMVALAVLDFITLHDIQNSSIKWPNDILVGNKKIAGILIENIIKGDKINFSIIGIGLNINQTEFCSLPDAISLKKITGKDYDINPIMEQLCQSLEKRYLQLKNSNKTIEEEYLNHLYRFKKRADYLIENKIVEAEISDIEKSGKIVLKFNDGTNKSFDLKEIKFVF